MTDQELRATRPRDPGRISLEELANWIGARSVRGSSGSSSDRIEITGLSLSSQRILPGDLYAALPGARTHGATFAAQAVESGAVAILTDEEGAGIAGDLGVPVVVVDRPRPLLGALAARVYGDPADALRLLAVTGTQGKTTVTRLAELALAGAGVSAAVIGTVGTRVAGEELPTKLTTPEAPDLHALFAMMRERGVDACAMEVSSHALVMGRVDGVVFDVAVFTNLGRDHLDFHADMEDYFAAKSTLFTPERARLGLVNLDDEYGRRLRDDAEIPIRGYGLTDESADWRAVDVELGPDGARFTVVAPDGRRFPGGVPIAGEFNVSNALAAIAASGELGLDAEAIAAAMASAGGVPGRLERVDVGQEFHVVVDYAHKPDAVEAALTTLRPLTAGRLIIVIGAGGDRDTGKRPVMGEIAARLADMVIVTDDNPRTEDAATLRAAVLAGTHGQAAEIHEIGDRREAIRAAIRQASAGDIVLIAGKGHETGQEVDGVMHPFDDREVAREELAAR